MPSQPLPPRPSLGQLRRRAKELRDAARSGDPAALSRVAAHGAGTVSLAAAQLVIAREHGCPSWPRLVAEVRARTAELGQRVEGFLVASVRDQSGRAARMLARDPWIAGYDVRAAVVLGDAARVREVLAHDRGLASRTDERTGWTALHAACASRWHRLDPARAGGLTGVARLLLAAGAGPAARPDGESDQWSPLLCAVAGAPNPAITGLLLEYGARPDDHVLYLAAFETGHECLRRLLPYAPDIASATALSAPISTGDVAGVRLLLDAGADPGHLLEAGLLGESHEQEPPVPPLSTWNLARKLSGCCWSAAPTPMCRAGTAAPPASRPSAPGRTRSRACLRATAPARRCLSPISSWPPAAALTAPPPRPSFPLTRTWPAGSPRRITGS
jgi:hypothetical protein